VGPAQADEPVAPSPRPLPLPLEVNEFLAWMQVERGRSPRTIEAYTRDLRNYVAWLEHNTLSVGTAGEADLIRWLQELRGTGKAASTVARAVAAVRSFHRFAAAEELLVGDPTAGVEVPRVPMGLPKALTEAEVTELLEAVDGDTPADRRDRSMLEMLYGSGVRISELVGLSLADVDVEARLMRVMGKGSKERIVPIASLAFEALIEWFSPGGRAELEPASWADRDASEAVYLNQRGGRLSRQGAWGVVKKYGAQVGLGARLSPHVLRHSCATHMLDHGADIRTVQELLGHASITTTQIYTKVSQERLFEVHRKAHPRNTV